jgi:hypothetical protein
LLNTLVEYNSIGKDFVILKDKSAAQLATLKYQLAKIN